MKEDIGKNNSYWLEGLPLNMPLRIVLTVPGHARCIFCGFLSSSLVEDLLRMQPMYLLLSMAYEGFSGLVLCCS